MIYYCATRMTIRKTQDAKDTRRKTQTRSNNDEVWRGIVTTVPSYLVYVINHYILSCAEHKYNEFRIF